MLFNEPKLLKFVTHNEHPALAGRVSVLFNEPKLLKSQRARGALGDPRVSVLFNEPKLLKSNGGDVDDLNPPGVSVLFNEPKLLKLLYGNEMNEVGL